jgi:hypothetical protein
VAPVLGDTIRNGGTSDPGRIYERMTPGPGFKTPALVSSPADAAAAKLPMAIAKFDAVPHQVFGGDIFIGVVAFHISGIDNVEFTVEGGAPVRVNRPQLNPQTRVWEYTALLRAEDVPDGPVEIRATANPVRGTPRVLPPLELWANGHGTLPHPERFVSVQGDDATGTGTREHPYRTIWRAIKSVGAVADNLTVFLGPGEHEYTSSGPGPRPGIGWTTITAAPGYGADAVRLVSANPKGVMSVDRLRIVNVTIDQRSGWLILGPWDRKYALWLDHVDAIGGNRYEGSPLGANVNPLYVTSSTVTNYRSASVSGVLCRDTHLSQIGSDAFYNAQFVVNSSVDGIDRGTTALHPDVWQMHGLGDVDNVILYNVRASNVKSQGVHVKDVKSIRNVAIVNFSVDKVESPFMSQWWVSGDHVLIWHASLPNSTWAWRGARLTNVSIVGSLWGRVVAMDERGSSPNVDASWYHNNHFIHSDGNSLVLGDGATTGDPGVVEQNGEFVPAARSVLKNRVEKRLVPVDLAGKPRDGSSSVGAVD